MLYHLGNDLGEEIDIAITNAIQLKELNNKLLQWETTLKKPLWIEPEKWIVVTQMIYEDLMSNQPIRAKSPDDIAAEK